MIERRCSSCGSRAGLNHENCRECSLRCEIAILRLRFRRQWLAFKKAIKEILSWMNIKS